MVIDRRITTLLLLLAAGCATAPGREDVSVPAALPAQPIDRLLSDLKSPSADTRATAAWALASAVVTPDQAVLDALHIAYADADEKVSEAATWALGQLEVAPNRRLYDQPPRRVRYTRPTYPSDAYSAKVEGTVMVEILISTSGKIVHAEVRRSIPGLDAAALQCVKQWLFEPGRLDGRPVPVLAKAPVTFRIK
jgi:TonB family protein